MSSLKCNKDTCFLTYQNETGSTTIEYARIDIKSSETVRHNGKDVVDVSGMKRKQANKIGYTVQIKVNSPPEPGSRIKVPRQILLHRGDMGRSASRDATKKLGQYIDRDVDELNLSAGSGWTSWGIIFVLFGFFSFVASFLFGQFSDPEPKRQRKIR